VGETGWNTTDADVPRLKAGSMVAFNNAPTYGVGILWKLSHAPPNLGAFTGSYAASNCPSAQ